MTTITIVDVQVPRQELVQILGPKQIQALKTINKWHPDMKIKHIGEVSRTRLLEFKEKFRSTVRPLEHNLKAVVLDVPAQEEQELKNQIVDRPEVQEHPVIRLLKHIRFPYPVSARTIENTRIQLRDRDQQIIWVYVDRDYYLKNPDMHRYINAIAHHSRNHCTSTKFVPSGSNNAPRWVLEIQK